MKNISIDKAILAKIQSNSDYLYEQNQRFVSELLEAVRYCAPLSDGFNVLYSYDDTGINLDYVLHDSTAKNANILRANELSTLLCPVQKQWGKFVEIGEENVRDSTTQKAKSVTNKVFNYISSSNFQSILPSIMQDVNIGCAGIWVDYVDKNFTFKQIAGVTLMPFVNSSNNNCFWRRVLTKDQFNAEFPGCKKEESDKNAHLYYLDIGYIEAENGQYYYIHTLDRNFMEPLKMELDACCHLILINDVQRAAEGRGRGVILNNLEDIRYLNEQKFEIKQYLSYSLNPLLRTDTNLPDDLLSLRGKSLKNPMNTKQPLVEPVLWKVELEAMMLLLRDIQESIRLAFTVLPLGEMYKTPAVTATEVAARVAQAQKQSLSSIARIANMLLGGLMDSVYNTLLKTGEISEEDALDDYDHEFVSIQETLQSSEELNSFIQYATITQQTQGQMALHTYNNGAKIDAMLKRLTNTTQFISNSPDEIKQILQGFAQQMQTQQAQTSPQTPIPAEQPGVPQTLGR